MAQQLGLPELICRILAARGIRGDTAAAHLSPTLRDFLPDPKVAKGTLADGRLQQYISGSMLTSFADVADVVVLLKMAGPLQKRVSVRFPRDLAMRDLDHVAFANPDGTHVLVLTNRGGMEMEVPCRFGESELQVMLPANSVVTLSW